LTQPSISVVGSPFGNPKTDWQSKTKEEGMRAFVAWILALGLIVSPAMAGTDKPGDGKDTTTSKANDASATTAKDKTPDATANAANASKTNATPAAPSSLENEIQQLRELIESQSKLLQAQSEQLKEQQHRMQLLESEVSSSSSSSTSSDAYAASANGYAPDSHTAGVASVPVAGVPTSSGRVEGQAGGESPMAIHFKGITITPGGFLAAETVFRNKAIGADVNTPFNNVPFPGNSGSQTTEFNASARQSRLSMLAEGRLATVKLSGYVETDFLSSAITSNDNESNSYSLRLRQGWGQAKFDDGWTVTGGQMWSLITETRKATDNRTEALPLTIDPAYTVGFSWARQYGFRVSKTFADKFTLAASVEESATTVTVHGNPTITTLSTTNSVLGGGSVGGVPTSSVTTSTLTTATYNNFLVGAPGLSGGVYNPTGTYAYNKTPDFVFKAALDPGWGHYELFGLVSTFRDRVFPCYYANPGFTFPTLPGEDPSNLPAPIPATTCALTGSTNPASAAFNNGRTGGGIGANARVPLFQKKVEAGIHFLGGSGIGRYGTAQLPDSTVRPDGTLALLRSYQALGTLEFHPTPKLDIYLNAGGEYASRASYAYTNLVTGKGGTAGYGSPAFRNDGCSIETLPIAAPGGTINTTSVLGSNGFIPGALSNCAGDARVIIEGTMGFWYRVYSGEKGRIQYGAQYSYLTKNAWSGSSGTSGVSSNPHGIDNMVFTSFRYYLP
jgi:hypothetical protein